MDVVAVRQAASAAVAAARAGEGPILLECTTYRFAGHSRSDARGYRSREEEAEWQLRDPIVRLRQQLLEDGSADEAVLEAVGGEVDAVLDDAVEFARSSPDPDPAELLTDAYA